MSEFVMLKLMSGAYRTTLNKMYGRRREWVPENPKLVHAFMPGTVEELLVKVGDTVQEGDTLMIFRAMKMKNRMLAPVAGRIARIDVAPGENVPKGTLMVEIE